MEDCLMEGCVSKRFNELIENYSQIELLKAWIFKELDWFYTRLDKEEANQFVETLRSATEENFLEVFKEAIINTEDIT